MVDTMGRRIVLLMLVHVSMSLPLIASILLIVAQAARERGPVCSDGWGLAAFFARIPWFHLRREQIYCTI